MQLADAANAGDRLSLSGLQPEFAGASGGSAGGRESLIQNVKNTFRQMASKERVNSPSSYSKRLRKAIDDSKTKGNYNFDATKDMNEFSEQIAEELKKYDLTLERFNELRLTPVDQLSDAEVTTMKEIRDAVPQITEKTLLQKVFPMSNVKKYLDGTYEPEFGGYIAKVEDVSKIRSYNDVVESSRLDYLDSNGSRPFPEDESSYGMLRFKTSDTDKIEIPYGKKFGGTNIDGRPCTQNGFTAARNGRIVPEWKFNNRVTPSIGSELYIVEKGHEILVGIFNGEKFVPVK